VRKVGDITANRIDANLNAVAQARLLDLPSDQTFTYDEFMSQQVGCWGGIGFLLWQDEAFMA